MGVMAALAAYRPRQIGIGLGVPLPMWAVLATYILIDLSGLTASTNVANEAHLLGVVSGLFIGIQISEQSYGKNEKDKETDLEEESWKQRIRNWEEKYMMD
jgi:membrane associated rhomboid family serine protease